MRLTYRAVYSGLWVALSPCRAAAATTVASENTRSPGNATPNASSRACPAYRRSHTRSLRPGSKTRRCARTAPARARRSRGNGRVASGPRVTALNEGRCSRTCRLPRGRRSRSGSGIHGRFSLTALRTRRCRSAASISHWFGSMPTYRSRSRYSMTWAPALKAPQPTSRTREVGTHPSSRSNSKWTSPLTTSERTYRRARLSGPAAHAPSSGSDKRRGRDVASARGASRNVAHRERIVEVSTRNQRLAQADRRGGSRKLRPLRLSSWSLI